MQGCQLRCHATLCRASAKGGEECQGLECRERDHVICLDSRRKSSFRREIRRNLRQAKYKGWKMSCAVDVALVTSVIARRV